MEEKPKPTRWVMWLVIGLLVAYPLSFGPVMAMYHGGHVPTYAFAPIRVIYTPFDFAMKLNGGLHWLGWEYIKLWQTLFPPPV